MFDMIYKSTIGEAPHKYMEIKPHDQKPPKGQKRNQK